MSFIEMKLTDLNINYIILNTYPLISAMQLVSKQISVFSITKRVIYNFSAALPPNFTLLSTAYSKDLKLNLHQYAHSKTNARIYHFQNSDPQNAYASIIKTYVNNDTGCPHILQHLATCGSQKYPIRDPFFNMLKRSVNTYMNAWTGDDFTSYPFSSANAVDWQNLYKVYLDMSLNASLNELDFRQQGWRYQIDEQGNRQIKGIVLNEMKGAYQDSDRQLMKQINMELFKGTPYVYDSGGRPKDIVNLEYHQLKKMYQYYYHPSNMSFYFYGNNPIQQHLQYLSDQYLDSYQNQSHLYANVNLNVEPITNKYKTITSFTSQTNNISINFNFGLNDHISPLQSMCLRILSYILLQKSNAKIYKQFIQTGVAQNIGFSGFNESKIATFTITLKGIYPNYQCQTFENQFKAMLQEIIQNGIQQERIQQFVHQFQTNLLTPRENNGIRILEECMNLMNHRLNFQNYLNPRPYLVEAATKLAQPQFIESLLNKFFINNTRMIVVRQLLAQTEYKEQKIQSSIIMDDRVIKQQQQKLLSRQNQPQNKNILPMLKISEITKPKRREPVLVNTKDHIGKLYQQYHVKIEQDINFYRLVFNFQFVDAKFLQGITLWMYNLNRVISTSSYTYNELTSQLANHTAGFNVFHSVGGKDDFNVIFQFSCLKKNIQKAFFLIQEIVFTPKFQKQNTLNAFKAFHNEVVQGLIENPMNECLNEAAGKMTKTAYYLNTYQRIKESLKIIKNENREIFYQISRWLNNCAHIKLIEHSNQKYIKTPSVVDILMKYRGQKMNQQNFKQEINQKGVIYNYMVNFCAQSYIAPRYLSKQSAYMNLLLQLLQQDYLHPLIRQKGGAYGTGARIRNNGIISLSSYLDPNTLTTFQIFDKSIKELLLKDKIEDQTLLQAKIKQFGQVDRVKIPQNEGVSQILKGYTQDQFDQFRQALKSAKFTDLVQTGRKYMINTAKSRCVFGKTCPLGFEQQKLKAFLS